MKNRLLISIVFSLFLAAISLSGTVMAGNIFKSRGDSAWAYSYQTDGCIETYVSFWASRWSTQNPPGPPVRSTDSGVYIEQFNSCEDKQLIVAYGSVQPPVTEFTSGQNLSNATLNATMTVWDYVSESEVDVTLDVAWTGVSPVYRSRYGWDHKGPHCNVKFSHTGNYRDAVASGVVSFNGEDISFTSSGALIGSSREMDVTVGCTPS